MCKNPLQIFIDSNEDCTSKMAGNIYSNRTLFITKQTNKQTNRNKINIYINNQTHNTQKKI
jgi:hypothetical protein